jgi:hypothetical protein
MLVAFFREDPGCDGTVLQTTWFISISYFDDYAVTGWWQRTAEYTYEPFELLHSHWHLVRVLWL